MRIIAGKHRGRKIQTTPGKSVRPTSGKAREAVFNILENGHFISNLEGAIAGQRVIDVCCGSGALGLEALSRGAHTVTMVDQDEGRLRQVRDLVEAMGESESVRCLRANATLLPRAKPPFAPCTLAFLDPPYKSDIAAKVLESLDQQGWLAPEALIVLETAKHDTSTISAKFSVIDERSYGSAWVRFLRYEGQGMASAAVPPAVSS